MLFYSQRGAMEDLQDNFEDETPQKTANGHGNGNEKAGKRQRIENGASL